MISKMAIPSKVLYSVYTNAKPGDSLILLIIALYLGDNFINCSGSLATKYLLRSILNLVNTRILASSYAFTCLFRNSLSNCSSFKSSSSSIGCSISTIFSTSSSDPLGNGLLISSGKTKLQCIREYALKLDLSSNKFPLVGSSDFLREDAFPLFFLFLSCSISFFLTSAYFIN